MANSNRNPEENNKTQEQSNDQAKQSARDERAPKGEQRTNRSESEHRESVRRVGDTPDGVYKHEGVGAVSREDMKVQAAVAEENKKSREQAEDEGLDTSPEAAEKLLEQGAKNKVELANQVDNATGEEISKALEEQPLRRVVNQSNQAEMHGSSASAPVVEYAFTTKLATKVSDSDLKGRVAGGFEGLYDQWLETLSSSEREAYSFQPENGIKAFRKHLTSYDENELVGQLTKQNNKK